jgi:phosphoglycolate phosphatase
MATGPRRAMGGHAVFDLDGTLVDSVPVFAEILNTMLEHRGSAQRISHDQARAHATAGGLAMVAGLLGEHCGDPHVAIAEFRERYAAMSTLESSLYPGVRDGLAALHRAGVVLALFSNKPQRLCDKVIEELGLAPLFGGVVGTGPGIPLKPDPAGLDLALARAGGDRRRCCYVGDSEADRELASRAGVPLVMATWGYGEAGCDRSGVRVAEDFAAVPPLVLGLLTPLAAAR